MKFNYFKIAKSHGHSEDAFRYAYSQVEECGNRRYIAAHWLAWAYLYQRMGSKGFARLALSDFLDEIKGICAN